MASVSAWLLRFALVLIWCSLLMVVLYVDDRSNPQPDYQSINQSDGQSINQSDSQVGFWSTWTPDAGPFCEYDRSINFLRERSNSLSDFAFLAVGLYLIDRWLEDSWKYQSIDQPPTLIHRYPVLSLAYGLANIFHAIGTFTNHACRCHIGHRIDLTGMWLVSFWSTLMVIMRLTVQIWPDSFKLYQNIHPIRFNQSINQSNEIFPTIFSAFYLLMFVVYWLSSNVWYSNQSINQSSSYDTIEPALLLVNILGVILFELIYLYNGHKFNQSNYQLTNTQRYDLPLSIIFMAALSLSIGALIGYLDAKVDWLCDPNALIQFHAIWHMLAAAGLLAMYQYFRQERSPIMKIKSISKEK